MHEKEKGKFAVLYPGYDRLYVSELKETNYGNFRAFLEKTEAA
jgi:hypothetical protein